MTDARLTPADLAAIVARAQAATPGPWKVVENRSFGVQSDSKNIACCFRRENEDFIARAREDIPYLLDLLAERDAEIERLREEVCKRCGVISGQLYGKSAACEYKPLPAPPEVEERTLSAIRKTGVTSAGDARIAAGKALTIIQQGMRIKKVVRLTESRVTGMYMTEVYANPCRAYRAYDALPEVDDAK